MALKGTASFDGYDTSGILFQFQDVTANTTIVAGAGRCGTQALRNTGVNGGGPSIGVNTSDPVGYCGVAYFPESFGVTQTFEVRAAAGGILAFIRVVSDGSVEWWTGPNTTLGTLIGATAAGLVSVSNYQHIGYEWKFDATVGYLRIWVNRTRADDPDFDSGLIDTTNFFTTGQWHQLAWNPKGYIDDVYWGDGAGAAPWNAFLGDERVEFQVPLTDADGGGGSFQEWTPSTGTDHGALVDEIPPDNFSTYVASATIGQRETFKFPPIAALEGTVDGHQYMPHMVKDNPGGRQVATLLDVSGTTANGSSYGVAQTTGKYYLQVFQANTPGGDIPWTVATTNIAQGGVEIMG